MTIGWLDCSAGASGDMLLGALAGAGVPAEVIAGAVEALSLPVSVDVRPADVGGLAGWRADVAAAEPDPPRRTLPDIIALLSAADLDTTVRAHATATFRRLADAEAAVHGTDRDDVHFHEVGALDAIADVVGACAGFAWLGLGALHASPVALGGGRIGAEPPVFGVAAQGIAGQETSGDAAPSAGPSAPERGNDGGSDHGPLPVPAPAVLELLRDAGAPCYGGPVDIELCTPTGAALLAEWVTSYGPMPAMTPAAIGVGGGTRSLPGGIPNVLRLAVGEPAPAGGVPHAAGALVIEANVDDLDPRLWPGVLARLLDAGAADAWLTPILAKKGRPAHTVHVLAGPTAADAVRRLLYVETTTIGVREHPVAKRPLQRTETAVDVGGQRVRVKLAWLDGRVVNAGPEYVDVAAAATALGWPVKQVLAQASAAALGGGWGA